MDGGLGRHPRSIHSTVSLLCLRMRSAASSRFAGTTSRSLSPSPCSRSTWMFILPTLLIGERAFKLATSEPSA